VLSFTPHALSHYGWSERVVALYNSIPDDGSIVADPATLLPGRITRVERSACFAVVPDGSQRQLRCDPLPAVGDWILAGEDAVRHILPQWSSLTRVDADGDRLQTLAANVDVVAVVTPADRSSAARVEREVTLAWDSGAVPLVVVTKTDLDSGEVVDGLLRRLVGVDVIAVSAVNGAGVEDLRARLAPDRTAVLLGPSGAGKSTLGNALLGAETLDTGAVRVGDSRGRHTTTSRQLVAIPGGGVMIDTPGLRSLGLPHNIDVGAGFRDVEALAERCRFSNCRHDGEPGCAVGAAMDSGELDPARLASFRKLAREVAYEARRHDPLKRREELQVWRARTKESRARRRDQGR
jgi:ribosome biogenesis GTPase